VVKFILVLVMLFNIILASICYCEIVDRILAYVENQAITLRDFELFSTDIKKRIPDIKNDEIVELLINRTLLIRKAKEIYFEGKDEEIINNYIDLKIRSKIIVPESKIRDYYEEHKNIFKDKAYSSVRDEIEKYLFERELNIKLKKHIKELRETSEIKIVFIP